MVNMYTSYVRNLEDLRDYREELDELGVHYTVENSELGGFNIIFDNDIYTKKMAEKEG